MIFDAAFFFTVGAAFAFSFADMALRSGLDHASPFVGAMIMQFMAVSTLIALILVTDAAFPPLGEHYFWMAVGGALNPGLFVIFFMFGISRIGVARAASIKGCSPIFASLMAVWFLGERPAFHHLGGVLLVVFGVALVSSGKTEGIWKRIHALWPIAAAGFAGMGAVFWRKGLPAFPDIIPAALVGGVAALVAISAYTVVFFRDQVPEGVRNAWRPFLLAGVFVAVAHFFYASALKGGEVFRIVSLIQLSPIITVGLALLLVRRAENITWRVPVGAILTVGGALLVNLRLGTSP